MSGLSRGSSAASAAVKSSHLPLPFETAILRLARCSTLAIFISGEAEPRSRDKTRTSEIVSVVQHVIIRSKNPSVLEFCGLWIPYIGVVAGDAVNRGGGVHAGIVAENEVRRPCGAAVLADNHPYAALGGNTP